MFCVCNCIIHIITAVALKCTYISVHVVFETLKEIKLTLKKRIVLYGINCICYMSVVSVVAQS